jgi:hypothetical protein
MSASKPFVASNTLLQQQPFLCCLLCRHLAHSKIQGMGMTINCHQWPGCAVVLTWCLAVLLLQVRGLPYRSSPADILTFFQGYQYLPDSLQIGLDSLGRPSGSYSSRCQGFALERDSAQQQGMRQVAGTLPSSRQRLISWKSRV